MPFQSQPRRAIAQSVGGQVLYSAKPARRTLAQKGLISLGVVSTTALLLVAGVLYWATGLFSNVNTIPVDGLSESASGVSNWLLVGTDSREGIDESDPNSDAFLNGDTDTGRRTDTIMVARVDANTSTIRLLSVPRDLWVTIAGTSEEGRVNGAFNAENGPARLVKTVEQNLDIEINQYAEVDFVGFQNVIDALGGVPMYFETPMRDPNTGLNIETEGCHTLGGSDALAFARSRKLQYFEDGKWVSDQTGDLGRATRQRYFLTRVADATAAKANLFDAGEFNRVATEVTSNLKISSGTSGRDLLALARTFRAVGSSGIETHSLPVVDDKVGKAAILRLQEAEADAVLDLFRETEEIPEGTVKKDSFALTVLNGSGTPGQAGEAQTSLESVGFEVGEIGDASEEVSTSVIRYEAGSEAAARTVAGHLDGDYTYELDNSVTGVVLVTGSTYSGVLDQWQEVDAPEGGDGGGDTGLPGEEPEPPADGGDGVVPAEGPDPAAQCHA